VQLGFSSPSAALNEITLLTAANQLAQFREECTRFEKRYKMSLEQFERRLDRQRGQECFEAEDDLMASDGVR
jgi:hypothetical protein